MLNDTQLKNFDIICLSTSGWEHPWGSKQQLMTRLAKYNRVLYVEYQASFLHIFLYPLFFIKRIKDLRSQLKEVDKNLFIFTPIFLLPFGYYSLYINKINQLIIRETVKRVTKVLNFKNLLLWIYSPSAFELVGKFNEKLSVYHCIADFSNEKKIGLRRRTIGIMEERVAKGVNIVLALTKELKEKYSHYNRNTYYFPSAVDFYSYTKVLDEEITEPPDIACIARPRLMIVGYLDGSVLDVDLIKSIALSNDSWSLIFIGPLFRAENKLKALTKIKNIIFLGAKEQGEIPRYIKFCDVCLVPYKLNKFTKNVSPLKFYEYMATGKPIVTSALHDILQFKDIVKIAHDKEEFINFISASLNEDSSNLREIRINLAKENSWEKRIEMLSETVFACIGA